MTQDPYQILGLSKDASKDEVTKAYQKYKIEMPIGII